MIENSENKQEAIESQALEHANESELALQQKLNETALKLESKAMTNWEEALKELKKDAIA